MSYFIKASTPEAMRDEIVKWLNQQASNHRIASCKMASMHKKDIELARAITYQVAANFLANCTVEVPAVGTAGGHWENKTGD